MTKFGRRALPRWALDELAAAGRENLDVEHAWSYDTKEDADAQGELSVLVSLGLDSTSTLVDLGAGTGQLAVLAADVCRRVVAVDVSPAMVQPLKAKVAAAGFTNVDIVQAGFLSYEHRDHPADIVYSRFALHHLPDFWKAIALDHARSMLRRGGFMRLWDVAYSFAPSEAIQRLEAWCAQYDDAANGGWTRADVEEHIRDEHSTFTWLLEQMIERSRFTIEDAVYSADGLFAKYVARAV